MLADDLDRVPEQERYMPEQMLGVAKRRAAAEVPNYRVTGAEELVDQLAVSRHELVAQDEGRTPRR